MTAAHAAHAVSLSSGEPAKQRPAIPSFGFRSVARRNNGAENAGAELHCREGSGSRSFDSHKLAELGSFGRKHERISDSEPPFGRMGR